MLNDFRRKVACGCLKESSVYFGETFGPFDVVSRYWIAPVLSFFEKVVEVS